MHVHMQFLNLMTNPRLLSLVIVHQQLHQNQKNQIREAAHLKLEDMKHVMVVFNDITLIIATLQLLLVVLDVVNIKKNIYFANIIFI